MIKIVSGEVTFGFQNYEFFGHQVGPKNNGGGAEQSKNFFYSKLVFRYKT
jgi:hypothetical protein